MRLGRWDPLGTQVHAMYQHFRVFNFFATMYGLGCTPRLTVLEGGRGEYITFGTKVPAFSVNILRATPLSRGNGTNYKRGCSHLFASVKTFSMMWNFLSGYSKYAEQVVPTYVHVYNVYAKFKRILLQASVSFACAFNKVGIPFVFQTVLILKLRNSQSRFQSSRYLPCWV
jgi:hypothetical protein